MTVFANVCRERNSVDREKWQRQKRQRVAWVLCCMTLNRCRLHTLLVRQVYIHRGTPHRAIGMSETKSHGPNVPSVPALGGISFSFAFRMPVMAKAKNGKAGKFTFSMNSICVGIWFVIELLI